MPRYGRYGRCEAGLRRLRITVGTSRLLAIYRSCDVPARVHAGGTNVVQAERFGQFVAPLLNAAPDGAPVFARLRRGKARRPYYAVRARAAPLRSWHGRIPLSCMRLYELICGKTFFSAFAKAVARQAGGDAAGPSQAQSSL
jgi:hypothetical protein